MIGRIIKYLLATVLVGSLAYYFISRPLDPEDSVVEVRVGEVTEEDLSKELEVIGTIEPALLTQIRSEVTGKVKAVHVESGDNVTTGDLLMEIDTSELESEVQAQERRMVSTQLRLEQATRDLARIEALSDRDFVNERELLDAITGKKLLENELAVQEAEVATKRESIAKASVYAPHEGVVLKLNALTGQVLVGASGLNAGEVPMEIASLDRLLVRCRVNEIDIALIENGMPVAVSLDSVRDFESEGTIASISPSAEQDRQSERSVFPVSVAFETDDRRVKPGMSARVNVVLEEVEGVASLPLGSVFYDEIDQPYVFLRESETPRRFRKVEVEIGLSDNRRAEVKGESIEVGATVAIDRPPEEEIAEAEEVVEGESGEEAESDEGVQE